MIGTRVPVLDKGWIELQDLMGDDNAIVAAARTSFLGESKGPDKDKKLLFYLLRHFTRLRLRWWSLSFVSGPPWSFFRMIAAPYSVMR